MTPLIIACKYSNTHCLKKLLSSGAEVNSVDGFGLRAVSHAECLEEDPHLKWRLQQWKMQVSDKQDDDGHYARGSHAVHSCGVGEAKGTHSAVQICKTPSLIESGCCSELESIENIIWSVAHAVGTGQQSSHLDVLHILITGGANLHMKDDFHKTATEYALNLYNFQAVLIVICHGALIDEDLLKSFLSTNYLRPKALMEAFIYPLVVALVWSSSRCHRLLNSYYLRISFHSYYDLPTLLKGLLHQPLSLARYCRNIVREALIRKSSSSIAPLVQQLPVPKATKQFLLLSDVLQLLLINNVNTMSE